ncbi:MAG: tRNA threonylcarbamoyladenosine dehydratase, partial [Clostridiales bacterium]
IDFDQVTVSNMNRQLCALTNTIGQNKTETMAARIELINPCCRLTIRTESITSAHIASIMEGYDYVVDAIDDVAAKTAIICYAHQNNIAVISAMGAAKRVRPELLRLADIADTHCCPLARIMRKELKKLGIVTGVNVVYSTEKPLSTPSDADTEIGVKQSLGSVVFVPGAMGLIIAGKVIRDVAGIEEADGFIRTSGYH